jgi:hypothetical protein
MRITGQDGTWLILRVDGYQFPAATNDLDEQWLMITGEISLTGRSWSFTDPCLMIDEARALATWLHAAATGHIQPRQLPTGPDEEWTPDLSFTEPVLAFSLGSGSPGLVFRVNVSLEAAPPWARGDQRAPWGYAIDLQLSAPELEKAANEWTNDLGKLPQRPRAPGNRQAEP